MLSILAYLLIFFFFLYHAFLLKHIDFTAQLSMWMFSSSFFFLKKVGDFRCSWFSLVLFLGAVIDHHDQTWDILLTIKQRHLSIRVFIYLYCFSLCDFVLELLCSLSNFLLLTGKLTNTRWVLFSQLFFSIENDLLFFLLG